MLLLCYCIRPVNVAAYMDVTYVRIHTIHIINFVVKLDTFPNTHPVIKRKYNYDHFKK